MEEQKNNGEQFQIELKEDVAQGTYANLAIITHSSSEFVLDFARILPGIPQAGVKSRVIMAPEHAKRLLFALEDNLRKYESMFGQVRVSELEIPPTLTPMKGDA